MENYKGFKTTLLIIASSIAIQVLTFVFLWGRLTLTVEMHEKDIDKILSKFDNAKIIYAMPTENGK